MWIALVYVSLWFIHDLQNDEPNLIMRIGNIAWKTVFAFTLNFIFLEYSIPFVLKKRRSFLLNVLLAFPIIFLHMILYSYGMSAWRSLGVLLNVYIPIGKFTSKAALLTEQMAFSMFSLVLMGISRHIYLYIKLKQATQKLRIEKQQAELNYLKSQTNPHFLFNTLNNIYALAKVKSDLAPESIMRLSKILRFMLYETDGDFISIEQELKIIEDYIELEKLRYDESLRINFTRDIEDMKQALPPLLLIPLVENAFKHGVSESRNEPFVDIHLSVNMRMLTFVVKNSAESSPDKDIKENIGLSNLRRQLLLLYKEYDLSLEHKNGVFATTLKINLASHV